MVGRLAEINGQHTASAASARRVRQAPLRPPMWSAAHSGPAGRPSAPASVSAAQLVVADAALGTDQQHQRLGLVEPDRRPAGRSRTRAAPAPPCGPRPTHVGGQFRGRHQRRRPAGRGVGGTAGPPTAPPPASGAAPCRTLAAPSQRATQRSDCQATNASAPASVASSTASSERSDFGSACTTVTAGDGGATARLLSTRAVRLPLPTSSTTHVRDRARAVAEVEFLTDPDAPHDGGVEALVTVDARRRSPTSGTAST